MNKAELIKVLAELLVEKIEIREEPTNGEVIQAMFPSAEIKEIRGSFDKSKLLGYRIWLGDRPQDFTLEFWNAPYNEIGNADTKEDPVHSIPEDAKFDEVLLARQLDNMFNKKEL